MRKKRERFYCWVLFALIAVIVAAAGIELCKGHIPYSQRLTLSEVLSVSRVPDNGFFYTVLQFCSGLSCIAAWCLNRWVSLSYGVGLALLPGLQLLGGILLSLKKKFGYKLLLCVLIATELFTGFHIAIGLFGLLMSSDRGHALLQEAFYIGLFLYPLLQLVVLHKWKENNQ